jgi:hypothetical protein
LGRFLLLPWPRTERRARRERAGAHAEARAEGRRHVAKEVPAAGAVAVVRGGSRDIGAHPLAAGFAERIDALHGKTGQVLHFISLRGRKAQVPSCATELQLTVWRSHLEKFRAPLAGQNPCHAPNERSPWSKGRDHSDRPGRAGTVPALGGFCRDTPVESREKATRYCGMVAEAESVTGDS